MLWPSIPEHPLFRSTLCHAASRVDGRLTLSTKLNHLPPLTPLPSADTIRSVQIVASAHHSPWRSPPAASLPCVALTALSEFSCVIPELLASNFLPPLEAVLLAAPLTAQKRHRYYEGSDSRRPHPSDGSLRLLRFAFPQANAVHHPGRHSDPNHAIRPMVALSVASAPSVIQGFALIQQARHGFTPKQVRAPTDWQFASSCSPRRLSATQLLSATKSRLTLTGTFTLLTKRPHGRTGCPAQGRA